jgi:ATP-binding cassette, subfamily F, member 3
MSKSNKATPSKPLINITAQQSRYAVDSVDAPETKDVFIKDLSISIGQNELISRTNVHFEENHHYVLVGRNGEGKSTLLRAFADKGVPGVPWNLRVLLLGQTEDVSIDQSLKDLEIKEQTVLEHVMQSDKERERLKREVDVLSNALEHSTDPTMPVKAYRQIAHERLERKFAEVTMMAIRRSGARGAKARQNQNAMEDEVAQSEKS